MFTYTAKVILPSGHWVPIEVHADSYDDARAIALSQYPKGSSLSGLSRKN